MKNTDVQVDPRYGRVVTTVEDAEKFWQEWFRRFVGGTITGVTVTECDEYGAVPVLMVRMPCTDSAAFVPVHEDPEGVLGTASGWGR